MIGGRHRSNMELVAQALRTSPRRSWRNARDRSDRAHGHEREKRRPDAVAGMVHAITLLLITLFFGRLAALIRWRRWRRFWSSSRST